MSAEKVSLAPEIWVPFEAERFLYSFENGQTDGVSCWRYRSTERRDGSAIEGQGLFANDYIPENTLVAIKTGHVVDNHTIKDKPEIIRGSHQQIGPNEFLTGLTEEEVDKNLVGYNHSCDPNARVVVFKGVPLAFLVTRRSIEAGDEITVDYSASEKTNTHFFGTHCKCKSPDCRGVITPGWDWEKQAIQTKYGGELPWFIQEEIDRFANLSVDEVDGYLKHNLTLLMAATVSMVDKRIKRDEKLIASKPLLLRPLTALLLTRKEGESLDGLRSARIDALTYFCYVCPFRDIEAMGVDRSTVDDEIMTKEEQLRSIRPMVEANVSELAQYAGYLDYLFN